MYNYKSYNHPTISEPIVVSFNKNDNNYYAVGFTKNEHDSNIERYLLVLKDRIHWKSPLQKEISVTSENNNYTLSNLGDTLFGRKFFVIQNTNEQNDSWSGGLITSRTVYGKQSLYYDYDFSKTFDTCSKLYITITQQEEQENENSPKNTLIVEGKTFIEKDYEVTPVAISSQKSFVSSSVFDENNYVLSISNDGEELVLLTADYEITINTNEETISTINVMEKSQLNFTEQGVLRNTYPTYTGYEKILSDRLRFVISDYGRIISIGQHDKNTDTFKDSSVFMFSGEKLLEDGQTVSVRVSLESKDSLSNVTANF